MYRYAEGFPRMVRSGAAALLVLFLAQTATQGKAAEGAVLTIDGAVTAEGGALHFDMAALQALPSVSFSTATNWTEGSATFTGVALKTLLDAAGATGTEVEAIALNNYAAAIPIDSIDADTPIVAYAIDGAPFPRRDKGPLWVVYPYDESAAYRNELVYGRSVWQLRALRVK
ncbi:MAG: hypothetical protein RIR62_1406 [Pseudomonadota bacterium]